MMETWQQPARPLPVPAPLLAGETTASYVRRLAESNGLDPRALLRHLGRGGSTPGRPIDPAAAELRRNARAWQIDLSELRAIMQQIGDARTARHRRSNAHTAHSNATGKADLRELAERSLRDGAFEEHDLTLNQPALQRLALVSNYPPARLLATLSFPTRRPLAGADPAWRFRKLTYQENVHPACSYCLAGRGITCRAMIRLPNYMIICRRHARWIANPAQNIYPYKHPEFQPQIPIHTLPELLTAARLHQRLVRCHGDTAVGEVFRNAHDIVTGASPYRGELAERWHERAQRLGQHPGQPTLTHLTRYPETIICASIMLSSYWGQAARRVADSRPYGQSLDPLDWDDFGPMRPHTEDFQNEIRRRLKTNDLLSRDITGNIGVFTRIRWRRPGDMREPTSFDESDV